MLRGQTVYLRALEAADLDFLYALENDANEWGRASDTLTPVSRYTLRRYLDNAAADFYEVRQVRLVICTAADDQAVGALDLFNFEPHHLRAAVGVMVLNTYRGRGYAGQALQLLLNYAHQTLHLHQVYCTVAANNIASIRLFDAAGFQRVGTRNQWFRMDGGWQDAIDMQCVLAGS